MKDDTDRPLGLEVGEETTVHTPDRNITYHTVRRTEGGLETKSALTDWREVSAGEVRAVVPEVDRGDGPRTDGGTERCEMRECEREVHDTVYPGDRKYRLCKPCTAAFLIGHQAGETDPSDTETDRRGSQ